MDMRFVVSGNWIERNEKRIKSYKDITKELYYPCCGNDGQWSSHVHINTNTSYPVLHKGPEDGFPSYSY